MNHEITTENESGDRHDVTFGDLSEKIDSIIGERSNDTGHTSTLGNVLATTVSLNPTTYSNKSGIYLAPHKQQQPQSNDMDTKDNNTEKRIELHHSLYTEKASLTNTNMYDTHQQIEEQTLQKIEEARCAFSALHAIIKISTELRSSTLSPLTNPPSDDTHTCGSNQSNHQPIIFVDHSPKESLTSMPKYNQLRQPSCTQDDTNTSYDAPNATQTPDNIALGTVPIQDVRALIKTMVRIEVDEKLAQTHNNKTIQSQKERCQHEWAEVHKLKTKLKTH